MISIIDGSVIIAYLLLLLGVGFYFMRKNTSTEDFFISGRSMSSTHIGLSVVATDVGGGFSIGLGGLGFMMGISGSWMLFTGLIGAWLSAVILIPRIYSIGLTQRFTTFPQILTFFYSPKAGLIAGIISLIGYLGFTSSQILAGAKLASAVFDGIDLTTALWIMGSVTVLYTVMGGMTAVIYTDTIQWVVLISGLLFLGVPFAWIEVGGWEVIQTTLASSMLSLSNITWVQIVNWTVTIIPIWFIGMTLYQRIYACKSENHAKRAWFIAGLFEWPVMAFLGVVLGLLARVYADNGMFASIGFLSSSQMDPETGLPLLLKSVIPAGFLGLMFSVYFSAILSTADSCLMAAAGNVITDILEYIYPNFKNHENQIRISQIITLFLGVFALILAGSLQNVLEMMLYSYAFMVSGLLIPLIGALFFKVRDTFAALSAMISGGSITLGLTISGVNLPFGLDAILFGLLFSTIFYISVIQINKKMKK